LAKAYPDAAKSLAAEADYFLKHHRRMHYMQLREQGWVIGSGMVESGIKQYKDRFCGAGMRWSRKPHSCSHCYPQRPIRPALETDQKSASKLKHAHVIQKEISSFSCQFSPCRCDTKVKGINYTNF
jgi:hypothetical protein